jgi:hypothetical protein
MAVQYGYFNNLDLYDQRLATLDVNTVTRDIELFFQYHNQEMERMLGVFASPTIEYQERFVTPVNETLQPLDENGRAKATKGEAHYTVGYPLHDAGAAWGANYIALQRMTLRELRAQLDTKQIADINWMRNHILAALFWVNTSAAAPWTFEDEIHGDILVYGLADGDATTYITSGGSMGTDDHVLGYATFTQTVIEDISTELLEHPQNGNGPVVVFMPTASVSTAKGFTDFIPMNDPLVVYGSVTSTVRPGQPLNIPGKIFGVIEGTNTYLSEWKRVPDNYVIGIPLGGTPPLKMREDEVQSLRGFNLVAERNDHPWYERQWLRMAGFGAYNRVGGVVARTNSATYAIPTNYSSPMP